FFFFSSRRRHTRSKRDWSSDVCSSDLLKEQPPRNYCEHKYRKSNCQFLCHKHFLSLPSNAFVLRDASVASIPLQRVVSPRSTSRSEERRVGKEWRSRWSPRHENDRPNL